MLSVLTIFGLLAAIVAAYGIRNYNKKRHLYHHTSKIDGPRSLPVVGSALYFLGDTKNIVNNVISLTKKYKSPWKIWLGGQVFIILTDPEDVKVALNKCLGKSRQYKFVTALLGEGLFTGPVDKWRRHRKVIMTTFNLQILNSYVEVFALYSEMLVENLQKYVGGGIFDVFPIMAQFSAELTCETTMGSPATKNADYARNLANAMDLVYKRILRFWLHPDVFWKMSSSSRKFNKLTEKMRKFITEIIIEKQKECKEEKEQKRKGFLDHLIEFCNSDKWTIDELMEEVQTVAAAGADALGSVPSFALMMLGMHPQIQEKLHQELEGIFDSDRTITSDDLNKMVYLEQVIKETLRLFPVATVIARSVDSDIFMKSYTIPKGAECLIGILHIHRNPEIYKDPLKFDPDRFLPEEIAKRHPYSFLPFSAGPRNCIGFKFAMMAMKTSMTSIVRNFRISTDVKSVSDIEAVPGIVFKSARGCRVALERR